MTSYSLTSLLNMRIHKENIAQIELAQAQKNYSNELAKLYDLRNSLTNIRELRIRKHNDFFIKKTTNGYSNQELMNQVGLIETYIYKEKKLTTLLKDQEKKVNLKITDYELAQQNTLLAHKNLKIIEKHHNQWLKNIHRHKLIREESSIDDFNCANFKAKNK